MDTEDDYVILDVRTQAEYDESHIPGAILIPHDTVATAAEDAIPRTITSSSTFARKPSTTRATSPAPSSSPTTPWRLPPRTHCPTRASSHIPGAILIPHDTVATAAEDALPDKGQLILVYCRSGNRSKQASQTLVDLGYTNVVEFGGINSWPYEVE